MKWRAGILALSLLCLGHAPQAARALERAMFVAARPQAAFVAQTAPAIALRAGLTRPELLDARFLLVSETGVGKEHPFSGEKLAPVLALYRVADFAAASEALGQGLGWPAGTFLADYEANRSAAGATQIEDSLVATVLIHHASRFAPWTGSPAELHAELAVAAGRKAAASARWPKSPRWFTDELRRIAPLLRMHGINVTFGRTYKGRFVTIEQTELSQNSDIRN